MIIDVTGIELTPGNCGRDCLGSGLHYDENGCPMECCCDECDYMRCCMEDHRPEQCIGCKCRLCPRAC